MRNNNTLDLQHKNNLYYIKTHSNGGEHLEDIIFSLEEPRYSGPLELLLSLISKKKINITEISLIEIIDQYLEQISTWQDNNIQLASEFLEMAARLVNIKTNELLPKHEIESAEKTELIGKLVEYSICRKAAQLLSLCSNTFTSFVREPIGLSIDTKYTLTHSKDILYEAYLDAIGRGKRKLPPQTETFVPLIAPMVSVDTKISSIFKKLTDYKKLAYMQVFLECTSKDEIIATFLAIIELLKENKIKLDNEFLSLKKNIVD